MNFQVGPDMTIEEIKEALKERFADDVYFQMGSYTGAVIVRLAKQFGFSPDLAGLFPPGEEEKEIMEKINSILIKEKSKGYIRGFQDGQAAGFEAGLKEFSKDV